MQEDNQGNDPKNNIRESQRKYREANKEKIAERAKEKKYWKSYYEKNKEKVRQRNLQKYYEGVGLIKKDNEGKIDVPATNETVLKLEGLLKDLQEYLPFAKVKPRA